MHTVFERFESIVDSNPTSIAFKDAHAEHTYSELYSRSLKVKSCISQLPWQQPELVALLFKDRFKSVAAMLGVTGTGHAYIPLDANDPDERLRFIAKDSGAVIVLAESGLLERAKALFSESCQILNYDDLAEAPANVSLSPPPTPDSLLYILYTSGSTGKPKGVCQNHANLLFYIDTYIEKLGIDAGSRISWLYAYSVSASNMDIYGALLSGAALCSFDVQNNGSKDLANWLKATKVSVLHTAPTVLRELLRSLKPDVFFPDIKIVDLAGEALYGEDIVRFRSYISPDCRFFNRLAATEICFIAQHQVDLNLVSNTDLLPVGRCPEGVEVSILLSDGSDAPAGEIGLIAIDSQYVCPGYLNRPELDAVTFSDTLNQSGWRRYKSSDLGMIDVNGNLLFIGREGSRIKLRGHSVDLSEIEAALLSCEHVSEAIVIPQAAIGKEVQELLACVSLMPGETVHPTILRHHLSKHIPRFMLPSGYIFSDNLPRTPSGKVDRQALVNLDLQQFKYRPDYADPLDDIEQRVTEIFTAVLEFQPIGRLDDFFLIGGDSLNLVNLQLLFRNEFGIEIPNIHENATVAGIAALLRKQKNHTTLAMPRVLPVQPSGTAPALFLVHGRRGQAHLGAHFTSLLGTDQPFYAIQARGLDGLAPPHLTINDMAADYVEAIRKQQPKGPYFLGALCAGGYVAIEMARLLRQQGAQVLPLLLIDPPTPHFTKGGNQLLEENLIALMKRRVENGDWQLNLNSNQHVQASINVARAFEDALVSHGMPATYDGPVFLISSKVRLTPDKWISKEKLSLILNYFLTVLGVKRNRKYSKKWGSKKKLQKIFGDQLTVFPVNGNHADLLDINNTVFEQQLAKCLALIREWQF